MIDPEVDEARWYLEQDLVLSQRVAALGLSRGVGYASESHPRHNLMGDPYYTDGLRLTVFFPTPSIHSWKSSGWIGRCMRMSVI